MADPIPRNSRADETAEYRRAEQERRANRPLFGQNMGGGLRARVDNPAPQAQPVAPPRPAPQPPRAPQAQPQALPRRFAAYWEGQLRRLLERPRAAPAVARAPQAQPLNRVSRAGRLMFAGVLALIGVLVLSNALSGGGVQDSASAAPPEAVAAAPMIPVAVPVMTCSVLLRDAVLEMADTEAIGRPALVARLTLDISGCDNQMLRSAVFVYRAENVPLDAPDAEPVYRSPTGQLTAQTLYLARAGEPTVTQILALPHNQFPVTIGAQQWLTFGVQVWPEGRAASAGATRLSMNLFTRVE